MRFFHAWTILVDMLFRTSPCPAACVVCERRNCGSREESVAVRHDASIARRKLPSTEDDGNLRTSFGPKISAIHQEMRAHAQMTGIDCCEDISGNQSTGWWVFRVHWPCELGFSREFAKAGLNAERKQDYSRFLKIISASKSEES